MTRPLPASEIITRLEAIDDGLTEWELDFLARMSDRVAAGKDISQGQYDKLWEILEDREQS